MISVFKDSFEFGQTVAQAHSVARTLWEAREKGNITPVQARNMLQRVVALAQHQINLIDQFEKPVEVKFYGTEGKREVCIQFFDTSRNNKPDGQTWLVIDDENRVTKAPGLECPVSYDHARFEKVFTEFKISRVEFTNERADAHPRSDKYGREQWQIVKIYGVNRCDIPDDESDD